MIEIRQRLEKWAKDRNITSNIFDLKVFISNHLEEEEELVDGIHKEGLNDIIDAICDKYVYAYTNGLKIGITEPEEDICNKACEIQIEYLKALDYDPVIALDECIKHIESRTQDPKQAVDWELNGPSGKWKKDESKRDEWYKPDYEKAMLSKYI